MRERFPRLIHCRISGFGADGPLGAYPGFDAIVQAMAGWFSVNGEEGSAPTRLGLPMVDMGTGLSSAVAILLALAERTRPGLGQFIDMTLYDCALALLHPHAANYALSGKVPVSTGKVHPTISPCDSFRTRSVDIFIGAGNDAAFATLCELLEAPELVADPRFRRNSDRVHMQHYGGAIAGTPIKFSRTPGSLRRLPPHYGEHTRNVLLELGLGAEEVQRLLDAGVVLERRREH